MSVNIQTIAVVAFGIAVGATGGAVAKGPTPAMLTTFPTAERIVLPKPQPTAGSHEVGAEGAAEAPFDVELEPSAVIVEPSGGQRMEFELLLKNKFGKDAAFQYKHQFVDDRGNAVSKAASSSVLPSKQLGNTISHTLTTPPALPDGFYQLRITVAASDGTNAAALVVEKPLQVTRGQAVPISDSEWFANSNANQATRVAGNEAEQ